MAVANLNFETLLKDHFDRKGLTIEDLKSYQCTESILVRLSKSLDNWEVVGFYLGLTKPEIKAIKVDSNSEEERRIKALNKWKEKNGDDATYYNLIEAFSDSDRVDMVDQALDYLKESIIEQKEKEQQRKLEQQKEIETKQDFLIRIKSQVLGKGLEVPDLSMNIRQEDIDAITELIGKDWYTFGKCMKVEESTLDHIKEVGKDKPGRKRKLLEFLISRKVRYEDVVYGLYNSSEERDPSINGILDYLLKTHRQSEDPKPHQRQTRKQTRQSSRPVKSDQQEIPWQADFDERQLNPPKSSKMIPQSDLTPKNYQRHFYDMLWLEEKEHMNKLEGKCDGTDYKLIIYDRQKIPPHLLQNSHPSNRYGYISGQSFTDDKIEYATQASDSVMITGRDGSDICIAYKHVYNFNHLENRMYVVAHNSPELSQAIKNGSRVTEGRQINVSAQFEVKHSYFDHLHNAVVIVPDYIRRCLLPDAMSFGNLFLTFEPQQSKIQFMDLDEKNQLRALKMIASNSSQLLPNTCPPPVILYGPFGSGKTRILARAAYEIMMNGIITREPTRILICAHHEQSIETFIFSYFGRIATKQHIPFNVILISRHENDGVYGNMYMSMDRFLNEEKLKIKEMRHVLIIVTYTMSLRLHKHLQGFFTHLLLDEAAQVREPEAITPLALATRNAKIVLAGDDKQVGPNILVLGEEARKYDLHISLLERLMKRYNEIGSVAESYVTKLSVNYRSHQSLMQLPRLFYDNIELNTEKSPWERSGPAGYSFVCSDSKLVPEYIDDDHPLVEACIVLEEVLSYLKVMKTINSSLHPRKVCIITSTRKQLNHIRDMANHYKEYEAVRQVSFKPSFMIQGHEFQAIFLSLFEPVQNDELNAFYVKSLFNPYVFNTVITRAKAHVVAIGRLKEVLQFEDETLLHPCRGGNKIKCWHEYLALCKKQGTLSNYPDISILERNEPGKETLPHSSVPLDQVELKKDTGGESQHCKGAESQSTQKISEGVVTQLSIEERLKLETDNKAEVTKLKKEIFELAEELKKLKQQLKEERQNSLRQNSDVKVASKKFPSPQISSVEHSSQSDDTTKKKLSTDAATSITVSKKECQELNGRKKSKLQQ